MACTCCRKVTAEAKAGLQWSRDPFYMILLDNLLTSITYIKVQYNTYKCMKAGTQYSNSDNIETVTLKFEQKR